MTIDLPGADPNVVNQEQLRSSNTTPNYFQNTLPVLKIDQALIDTLKQEALNSPLKRFRICCHHSHDDPVQEMIIVLHKSTVMGPHRHPTKKSESYHIIEGELDVLIFDDTGELTEKFRLSREPGFPLIYRLSAPLWHLPVPASEWVVYHEIYTGPFNKNLDVEYASWAPPESNPTRLKAFVWSKNNRIHT